NEYEVDSGTLSTIWGFDDLDTSNCVLFDGNKTPESWGPHVKRQAFEMFNIQRVLLRIEQNQANMDTHLTRVDRRLSRIEQYLDIDEDEDQD
ncbi:hypothetical protein PIB30_110771, partial [Stylosanthes scabra]|nr:hypothetical protein [Stylosanthes scabra]